MKQAVVFIHGIGEQKPMSTLRPFVETVLSKNGVQPEYYSKPDPMSELFELRQLRAYDGATTDFYEYYWAYKVHSTKWFDILAWGKELLFRASDDVPSSMKVVWSLGRFLFMGFICLLLTGFIAGLFVDEDGSKTFTISNLIHYLFGVKIDWGTISIFGIQISLKKLDETALSWLILAVFTIWMQYMLLQRFGDAARYLRNSPGNIKLRQEIRKEGLHLLRNLHQSGNYDRIIIVGHSLGAVIGYDLITHFWQECNDDLSAFRSDKDIRAGIRHALANRQHPQEVVEEKLREAGLALKQAVEARSIRQPEDTPLADDFPQLTRFRDAQTQAFLEQRTLGNPWLISDFITLGNPIAHGALLLATGKEDFEKRQKQRELPTCPPQPDNNLTGGYSYRYTGLELRETKDDPSVIYKPVSLHHAAPFAVTRWTNLFFPSRFGLIGDVIGGPVGPAFGPGVKDIPVRTTRQGGFANWTLTSHTSFWWPGDQLKDDGGSRTKPKPKRQLALEALRQELNLSGLSNFAITPLSAPAEEPCTDKKTVELAKLQEPKSVEKTPAIRVL